MRAIHLVRLDETRPVVVLTRESVLSVIRSVTVAPITSTIKGLSTEILVGPRNGLDHASTISVDNIMTIPVSDIGRLVGHLHDEQEVALSEAIMTAFDLRDPSAEVL